LQITDLEQTPMEAGDVVILFVGYRPPTAADAWPKYAALSSQASEWLVAKRIRALATDMPAISSFEAIAERLGSEQPPEKAWSEYIPLFQAQIPVIAGLVNLEAIAKEPHVTFVALPLATAEGAGAPVRAAAFVY
jgi:kynurenine formamidase